MLHTRISLSAYCGFFFTFLLVQTACEKNNTAITVDCTGVSPTYTNTIKAIMDSKCATSGCHSAARKEAGYDLSSFAGTSSGANNSKFMASIRQESGAEAMPHGAAKLDEATIKQVACWIQNGKPQ
jgi:cytochrome c553